MVEAVTEIDESMIDPSGASSTPSDSELVAASVFNDIFSEQSLYVEKAL